MCVWVCFSFLVKKREIWVHEICLTWRLHIEYIHLNDCWITLLVLWGFYFVLIFHSHGTLNSNNKKLFTVSCTLKHFEGINLLFTLSFWKMKEYLPCAVACFPIQRGANPWKWNNSSKSSMRGLANTLYDPGWSTLCDQTRHSAVLLVVTKRLRLKESWGRWRRRIRQSLYLLEFGWPQAAWTRACLGHPF